MTKLRFCQTLNYIFKNQFFKSHILKSFLNRKSKQTLNSKEVGLD
jgi:hypothetical protein